MYVVHPSNTNGHGAAIPVGWKIIVKNGIPYYVRDNNYDHDYALAYLRSRVQVQ